MFFSMLVRMTILQLTIKDKVFRWSWYLLWLISNRSKDRYIYTKKDIKLKSFEDCVNRETTCIKTVRFLAVLLQREKRQNNLKFNLMINSVDKNKLYKRLYLQTTNSLYEKKSTISSIVFRWIHIIPIYFYNLLLLSIMKMFITLHKKLLVWTKR